MILGRFYRSQPLKQFLVDKPGITSLTLYRITVPIPKTKIFKHLPQYRCHHSDSLFGIDLRRITCVRNLFSNLNLFVHDKFRAYVAIGSFEEVFSQSLKKYTGQQRKNAQATVTFFVSTNSTVYVSSLHFSWN